jgi:phosphatidylglycerophosphatase A
MKKAVVEKLIERDVGIDDIAVLVYDLQKKYIPDVTMKECTETVQDVLEKREVQTALLTGISLDILAEKDLIEEPLLSIIKRDESLYGIDEILALSITNIYGSIGLTNFGYLDKIKPGILGKLNEDKHIKCNTFLDDLVAGVAAAACAKLAHSRI